MIDTWKGEIRLNNLQIKQSCIQDLGILLGKLIDLFIIEYWLGLPLILEKGVIGNLVINIPWNKFLKQSC